MGSGATSLPYKVSGIGHSWLMETLEETKLRHYISTQVSFTSDMGTELGTGDFPNMQMDGDFLPGGPAPLLEDDVGQASQSHTLEMLGGIVRGGFFVLLPNCLLLLLLLLLLLYVIETEALDATHANSGWHTAYPRQCSQAGAHTFSMLGNLPSFAFQRCFIPS
jgi:hypothetical protein